MVKSGYSLCHVLGFKSQPIVLQLRDDLHVHVFLLVHLLHVLIIVNDTVVSVVTCIRILLREPTCISKSVVVVVGARLSRTVLVSHISRSDVGTTTCGLCLLNLLRLGGCSGHCFFGFL